MTNEERIKRTTIPAGKIDLIIDSDAKNEIDDQFAISWALSSTDRFNVKAIYAAPFSHDRLIELFTGKTMDHKNNKNYMEAPEWGMMESYKEIKKICAYFPEKDIPEVITGSGSYIGDMNTPIESDAARDLIERCKTSDKPVYVAAIGAITNIASAIMLCPEIIDNLVVVWLGGQPLYFKHAIEFNLMQDVKAAQVVLDSGVPLVYVPCMNVASNCTFSKKEVEEYLMKGNKLSQYLGQNVLDEFKDESKAYQEVQLARMGYLLNREDQEEEYLSQFKSNKIIWTRIIWDVSCIAFLKNPTWAPSTIEYSPVLNDDMTWGPVDKSRHSIRVVNYCHRNMIFGDMIASLSSMDIR